MIVVTTVPGSRVCSVVACGRLTALTFSMRNKINWPAPPPLSLSRLDTRDHHNISRAGTRGLISSNQRNLSFYQHCDQPSEWVRGDQVSNDNWTVYNGSITMSHSSKSQHTFNWQTKKWTYLTRTCLIFSWLGSLLLSAPNNQHGLSPISVWDMILCIPDNYFYSPRLSDSLREITLGWLLDTELGWTLHIGREGGDMSLVIFRPLTDLWNMILLPQVIGYWIPS